MPHINEMKGPSKYLTKEDVGRGLLVTVKGITQKDISREPGKPDFKWLLWLNECEKPLIINATNVQLAARACGSENTDDWKGKQIVLYTDPNVSFGGQLTGGIRIRAPKPQAIVPQGLADTSTFKTPASVLQKQAIAAAAQKWTKTHTMSSDVQMMPETAEEMLDEDSIPF